VVHGEGLYPNLDGEPGQVFYGGGGPSGVVLFQLADGTYRAIGVGQVPSQHVVFPIDRGPGVRQEHTEFRPPAPTI
jgi:hypothetical protein